MVDIEVDKEIAPVWRQPFMVVKFVAVHEASSNITDNYHAVVYPVLLALLVGGYQIDLVCISSKYMSRMNVSYVWWTQSCVNISATVDI